MVTRTGASASVTASAAFAYSDCIVSAVNSGNTKAGSIGGIIEPKYAAVLQPKFLNAESCSAREVYSWDSSDHRIFTHCRGLDPPKLTPTPSSKADRVLHCSYSEGA